MHSDKIEEKSSCITVHEEKFNYSNIEIMASILEKTLYIRGSEVALRNFYMPYSKTYKLTK